MNSQKAEITTILLEDNCNLRLIKIEDRGDGLVAIIWDKLCDEQFAMNAKNLEIRIKNLEKNGYVCSFEKYVLRQIREKEKK